MADVSRYKALADRLLGKAGNVGLVTVRNEALNADTPAQSQAVRVKLLSRKTSASDDAANIDAIMTATAFPIEGGELTTGGVTYDIVAVDQVGVGSEHVVQRVVFRER